MITKKLAIIANGITQDDPDALETVLRNSGQAVEIFDVRALKQNANGFETIADGKPVDVSGYHAVTRIIRGGVAGDTEKSWALQKAFEDAGAKPHIGIEAARKITDKILCKETLAAKNVPVFPTLTIGQNDAKNDQEIEAALATLGEPRYVVRKSIGSAKDSLLIANSPAEALHAIGQFRNPPDTNAVRRGVIVHKLPPTLDAGMVQQYGLGKVTEPEKRPYQFRIILVDGKVFGTNIGYAEPNQFGLNPAQGATFKAIPEESVSSDVIKLAKQAADAHGLKLATVDIALDSQSQPRVIDMNASPDLSFKNAQGEQLVHAVSESIQSMMAEGKYVGDIPPRGSSWQSRT